ncbi:ubiquinol-cytochrome c reductase iron-sulfur subunit [Aliikangiella coralliicola]|uniref:Ubiquinol-cytochrome c reductase iron-sulfur subunit n=1 Tax=Aliikangiella coralliicola TaxID=2592383 RepID=A0A545UK22_9GAMM|nr:ubiquinol-cytochrome c reductase iron-sulfur subunit [Aliikangiella coralliicola]TQV89811.1 ubiquinol-cytochrome c reductase iron-sulfur subunit [Aliikangiella coralliicola]
MSNDGVDSGKRRFLTLATSAVGVVGAGFVAVPFLGSWKPSAKAQAAGAPVEVPLDKLEEGQMVKVEWRGKPVFVVKRSETVVDALKNTTQELKDPESQNIEQQPEYVDGVTRSIRPDVIVLVGICTHLGCVPQHLKETEVDWGGGFFCPCHGSRFDLAGRVFAGVPASKNLQVPPYSYQGNNKIVIGVDEGAA